MSAVFPNQLLTGVGGIYNGHSCAQVILPQLNEERWLTRIILQTTLVASDLIGGAGGAYWNTSLVPPKQAPFYLFLGTPAVSNLIDLALIGSVNVGEFLSPVKVPRQTELWGIWDGVIGSSAMKCQGTFCLSGA
ncbi:hypothetical protein ACWCPQ_34240 [Nocardia sp. NPDC001965]